MRACEGCRRRKIKCDAATTNSWPCAACTRLKLTCIPPTVSYENDSGPGLHTFDLNSTHAYPPMGSVDTDSLQRPHHPMRANTFPSAEVHTAMYSSAPGAYDPGRLYSQGTYAPGRYVDPNDPLQYSTVPTTQAADDLKFTGQALYTSPTSESGWRSDLGDTGIAEALGQLRIDHDAIAPYILSQKKLAEAPAMHELEIDIPEHTGPGMTVHIPSEMMPSETKALHYFEYFFAHIHPFVPVLNRAYFYQQWQADRSSISPLLLEGIFACASLMLGEQDEGNKWLALASKHEENFRDVPRLSTIQAMILLLKAREGSPKRGYFYRSWMTVVNAVAMSKDLDLQEHLETHQLGKPCGSSLYDCGIKTRVWDTLFVLEVMVGGPQGRSAHDFGVKPDTVELDPPQGIPGFDEHEMQLTRQFTYFMRIADNIRNTNKSHLTLRKRQKDWAVDPRFTAHNQVFSQWLHDLPQDLQIIYPQEPSLPWIPSTFVGHLHCYHYLSLIMHHRPQIDWLSGVNDASWKQHFILCYNAAKTMCRISESIWEGHGLPGLVSMLRGISFTIYCTLTCIMLHLAAITSPDAELNHDAREYFSRHMRVLEKVAPAFPMPEMQAQINGLREAFSADVTKPFELKASFPFSSPTLRSEASPIGTDNTYQHQLSGQDLPSIDPPGQVTYHTHPITPPISATGSDTRADSPVVQSLMLMAQGQGPPQSSTGMPAVEHWNPSRIFDQWHVAFGTPTSQNTNDSSSQASPPLRPPPLANNAFDQRSVQEQAPPSVAAAPQPAYNQAYVPQRAPGQTLASSPVQQAPSYVTPSMWQDAVASSFSGMKRRWDYGAPNQATSAAQPHQ
ncbi:hypothetical protein P152DRAFT_212646 [Eremomyces bilateralis CBS 781.70]|uniref:Zn(2)-C6 fungal-type domain-containing protein n=1 Tax=Eremomyces bilateralis CBS 781.70 TaxID=1392243 RepID=A0A6G1FSR2_9PEZI|nr:uncharacterized protein P152DRAFT_212646 [Eremomyces bilateralis CBS 781.70]KAF1808719.1 hypothetical protein P152DRAFT_212646 [Eremomyces bilateralis CBS 781.70]